MFEKTLAEEFHISYSHSEWNLPSLCGENGNKIWKQSAVKLTYELTNYIQQHLIQHHVAQFLFHHSHMCICVCTPSSSTNCFQPPTHALLISPIISCNYLLVSITPIPTLVFKSPSATTSKCLITPWHTHLIHFINFLSQSHSFYYLVYMEIQIPKSLCLLSL